MAKVWQPIASATKDAHRPTHHSAVLSKVGVTSRQSRRVLTGTRLCASVFEEKIPQTSTVVPDYRSNAEG